MESADWLSVQGNVVICWMYYDVYGSYKSSGINPNLFWG